MDSMVTLNIDINPYIFESLSGLLRSQVTSEDTQLFLFHQRKPAPTSSKQRTHLLQLTKTQLEQALHQSANINTVHFIDCCGDRKDVHSDVELLAGMLQLMSGMLEPDVTADVVLMDYLVTQDQTSNLSLSDISVRDLFDPSILEERSVRLQQAIEDIAPSINPDFPQISEDDIDLVVSSIMMKLQAGYSTSLT